ncbi:two-component sensor histidine kinase PleC [alpha proteobacterium U9-1i]|nr:two-component sensor histidine kinase PleC [alpha proteobacterium U9-1i]
MAVLLVGVAAWAAGANPHDLGRGVALAVAPALAGFILAPALGERFAAGALLVAWLLSATVLAAATGGALSPLAAMFALVITITVMLDRRWTAEVGAVSVLAYAAAAWLATRSESAIAPLGAFPELLGVLSLAFTAALLTLRPNAREGAMAHRVAEVSHELRTPLTHILGFSEMIERRMFGDLNDRYAEYAGLIRQSGAHLLGLVNDLLDLSKIEAGKFELERERFDVRDVIDEVVRMSTDAAAKKSIAIGMTTPAQPMPVNADARALRRMLINTVGNAIKFTPDGGRVVVAARAEDSALVLETIDTGPGIPEAERGTLGHAYERGSGGARAEGTGLGLALVRALAELHGGTLSFHDAPGGGALVRLRLPVLAAPA